MLQNIINQLRCNTKLLSIMFFLILPTSIYSQGFDWQWTAKFPTTNPKNYIGADIKYGLQYLQGAITFLEDKITCPNFNDGNGYSVAVGADFERWEKYNRFCYRANIQFEYVDLNSASLDYVPLSPDLTAEYETALALQISKINLSAGIKYRLPNTHFNIGADLLLAIVLNDSYILTETILGPPSVPPFPTVPPSNSRTIATGAISQINKFIVQPVFGVGYDLPLARGAYIEPSVSIAVPTATMLSGDNVRNYSLRFGIKFLTALW